MQVAGRTIQKPDSGKRSAGTLRSRAYCLGLVLLATVPVHASELTETIVRIYPTATVNADLVILSDIAELSGHGAELAKSWPITAAPAHGRETTLDQDAIQQALIRKGINPSMWVFRGSSRCRISRPMPVRSAQVNQNDRADVRAATTQPASTLDAASATGNDALPTDAPVADTLEGAIFNHLAERLSALGGRPKVETNPALRELLQLSRPAYDFAITDRSDRLLGLVPLDVTIYREGKVEQVRCVLAQVSLIKPVVVATGPINRGQTIKPEHVTVKEQTFDRPDRAGLGDVNAIVGQRALRLINKDELVTGKDIEPVPLIVRNDLVTVTARRGSITIKGVAKALTSAGYGEAVELRNEASKQTFVAKVTGLKTAEMSMGASGSDGVAVHSLALAGGND